MQFKWIWAAELVPLNFSLYSKREQETYKIYQYNDDGSENSFKEVLDVEKDGLLWRLHLVGPEPDSVYVDLKTGEFFVNGCLMSHMMNGDFTIDGRFHNGSFQGLIHPNPPFMRKKVNYRVVNARRRAIMKGPDKYDVPVKFIVGWQATVGGSNVQRLMIIDEKYCNIRIETKR